MIVLCYHHMDKTFLIFLFKITFSESQTLISFNIKTKFNSLILVFSILDYIIIKTEGKKGYLKRNT